MFWSVQPRGLFRLPLGSSMLSTMTLDTLHRIFVCNRALKKLTATLMWHLWDFLMSLHAQKACFAFTTSNFEGLNLKIEFLWNFSKKSIKWVCELQKHLLMRLDLNFYARNCKTHDSEAQNANASRSEKSIFWGSTSWIFLKDFVRDFGHQRHVLVRTATWAVPAAFGL